MPEITVSLPDALEAHVREQVASGGFLDASDYVRALIRADRERGGKPTRDAPLGDALTATAGEEIAKMVLGKLRRKPPSQE